MLHLMYSTLSTLPLDVAFSPILFLKKEKKTNRGTGCANLYIFTYSASHSRLAIPKEV